LNDVKKLLKKQNATFKGYKNERGLIGAASAVSWRPLDGTHEVIVYRDKKRWGAERKIDKTSVVGMDRAFSSTFNNYDYRNKQMAIAPNSPCPVLFGIRGNNPKDLPKAASLVKSEKKDRWILFLTNQGTDEHLQRKSIRDIPKYGSVITTGMVSSKPKTIEGGHVIFSISGRSGRGIIDCAAYEPTKEFRNLVRKLVPADVITVYGGVRKKPLTINIEKMKIEKLAGVYQKVGNPICPKCKKSMKSMGKNAGYRCPKCRTKADKKNVRQRQVKRDIKKGFYEVPVSARRHLAKPLKRF
jgi:tRNA(Ile2)-agmatinylcytidine synthase